MEIHTFVMGEGTNYKEYIPQKNQWVNKYYWMKGSEKVRAIPDACLDIQIVQENEKISIYICGSYLTNNISHAAKYDDCFGIKMQPGIIPEALKNEIRELTEKSKAVTPEELIENIPAEFRGRIKNILSEIMNERKLDEFDFEKTVGEIDNEIRRFIPDKIGNVASRNYIAKAAAVRIVEEKGNLSMNDLAQEIGYSLKYLDRCFRQEFGLPMKKYAVIIRMQNAITYLLKNLADNIYEDLGYYDQAYFIRECKKYTGCTPKQLVGEKSDVVLR